MFGWDGIDEIYLAFCILGVQRTLDKVLFESRTAVVGIPVESDLSLWLASVAQSVFIESLGENAFVVLAWEPGVVIECEFFDKTKDFTYIIDSEI